MEKCSYKVEEMQRDIEKDRGQEREGERGREKERGEDKDREGNRERKKEGERQNDSEIERAGGRERGKNWCFLVVYILFFVFSAMVNLEFSRIYPTSKSFELVSLSQLFLSHSFGRYVLQHSNNFNKVNKLFVSLRKLHHLKIQCYPRN